MRCHNVAHILFFSLLFDCINQIHVWFLWLYVCFKNLHRACSAAPAYVCIIIVAASSQSKQIIDYRLIVKWSERKIENRQHCVVDERVVGSFLSHFLFILSFVRSLFIFVFFFLLHVATLLSYVFKMFWALYFQWRFTLRWSVRKLNLKKTDARKQNQNNNNITYRIRREAKRARERVIDRIRAIVCIVLRAMV